MKKLAIFVEGQTEQIFIDRLVNEIASKHTVAIEQRKVSGGTGSRSRWVRLYASSVTSTFEYFILIVDCSADNRVKSEILENYDLLVSNGYSAIIGIRDVFPIDYAQIPKLRANLQYKLKTKPVSVVFVLGVMEIETWFIAEYTHFLQMDSKLSTTFISSNLGFDPSTDDLQLRRSPASDLDDIYRLAGRNYKKNRCSVQRTVDLLDYAILYLRLIHKLPNLKTLVESLDSFLGS